MITARRQPRSLLATALVAVIALGTWWFSAGSGVGDGDAKPGPSPTTSYSGCYEPLRGELLEGDDSTSSDTCSDASGGLPSVELDALPAEADETVELIDAGGPYPYDEDDGTFGNYEGLLPAHDRGYYREYTVETPGSSSRGARRIIASEDGVLYWTADHYDSFAVIRR